MMSTFTAAKFELNEFGATVTYVSPPSSSGPAAARPAPEMPATIGRYEIRGTLGQGGFGAVYRGYDRQLDRQVAIKVPVLKPTKDREGVFLQEARQLAQLKHASIVTVHDVGVHDGVCYIVSEYLDGPDLNHWLGNRTLGWEEAARLTASLADALAVAHARNIVHRDVKPGNIIMTEHGEGFVPVLVDFGLALSDSSAGTLLAKPGLVLGTPNYMSPEQVRGEVHRI